MKNKLYICEHQFVISNNNMCDKCRVEEVSETLGELLKSNVVTVDDNKQKINQHSLSQQPKMISDFLIETLTKQNNEIRKENIKLGEDNTQLSRFIDKNLINEITELEDVIFNLKKENKYYKTRGERLIKENTDLNETISNGREENKRFKSTIERLRKEINGNPSERDYKDLEDNYNKLFQLGLTNACDFTALKYEHETMKKDYTKLLNNKTTSLNKFNKLERIHKSLIEQHRDLSNAYKTMRDDYFSELISKHSRRDELININKELSNELEQSKKTFH